MSRRRGLGSGLDALLPTTQLSGSEAVRQLRVSAIRGNRSQPRTQFDEQALEELAASIREHGILQPVIVSEDGAGGYELVAGERRWRAAQRAGLHQIPAIVKSATPQQLLELALVENIQRADLNPLEEGVAYQTLKEEFGLSDEEIGLRVGKSRVAVVNTRRLIKLIPEAREALLAGAITAGHGRVLLRFEKPAEQLAALRLLLQQEMNVREAERFAEVAQHSELSSSVRDALLEGTILVAHGQALLRLPESSRQTEALKQLLGLGLGVRETEQLIEFIARGVDSEQAAARLRSSVDSSSVEGSYAPSRAERQRAEQLHRELSPEDAEAQRLFEEVLETPVQLVRSGGVIRLSITLYNDEQLQQLYERLAAGQ